MNLICSHAAPIYGTPCCKCRTEYNDARDMVNDRLKSIKLVDSETLDDIEKKANDILFGMILPGGYGARVYIEEGKLSVRYFR